MKKSLMVTAVSLTIILSSTPVFAEDENKAGLEDHKQVVGMGTGAIIGGFLGGPLGAAIGGVSGILFGDLAAKESEIKELDQSLASKTQALEFAATENEELLAQLHEYTEVKAQLVSYQSAQPQSIDTNGLELSIQFQTGSHTIESVYEKQLDALAKLLDADNELAVHLAAFADHRGQADFNQALSAHRLASVQQALIEKGVNANQISGKAFGAIEIKKVGQTHERLFFDRRVTITLRPAFTQVVAN